jgi:hypothetical protein
MLRSSPARAFGKSRQINIFAGQSRTPAETRIESGDSLVILWDPPGLRTEGPQTRNPSGNAALQEVSEGGITAFGVKLATRHKNQTDPGRQFSPIRKIRNTLLTLAKYRLPIPARSVRAKNDKSEHKIAR